MTIDEAIANYQGISNYLQRYHAPDEEVQLQITNAKCIEWFTEVAEWLRELKEAKRFIREIENKLYLGTSFYPTSFLKENEKLFDKLTEGVKYLDD